MNDVANTEGFPDFREMLRSEFALRSKSQPSYSLRDFARDVGASPSLLSEVFRGKSNMSPELARKVAQRLGFDSDREEIFCELVAAEGARSAAHRQAAVERLRKRMAAPALTKIEEDRFRLIADWPHLAIYCLTGTRGFDPVPEALAAKLRIPVASAQEAWERLVRLGLVVQANGAWKASAEFVTTLYDIPSEARRSCQTQLFERARETFEEGPGEHEIGSVVLSCEKAKLGRAKELIREFQAKFLKELSAGEPHTDVFCLNLQFFNLTASEETK